MTMNAINSVNSTTNSYQTSTSSKTASTSTDKTTTSDKAETGVVYEKSSQTEKDTVTKKTDYALVAKLKADAEQRTSSYAAWLKNDDQAGNRNRKCRFHVELLSRW